MFLTSLGEDYFFNNLLVEDIIIIELKSVENIMPVHKKQLLTYLKLTGLKLGLLVNFNVELIKYLKPSATLMGPSYAMQDGER